MGAGSSPGLRARISMQPDQIPSGTAALRQPFAAGWAGFLAVGLAIYVLIAILLTSLSVGAGPMFELFTLFSDSPASIGSAILAALAARGAHDLASRRTWQLLAASLAVYSVGNLLNSTYWYFGHDPFPSVGEEPRSPIALGCPRRARTGYHLFGWTGGHPSHAASQTIGPSHAQIPC